MNAHDYMVDVAKRALGIDQPSVMRIGPALPDEPQPAQPARRERRRDWDRREDFDRVVTGQARDFWNLSLPYEQRYDCEQEVPIYAAVWAACQMPAASDAERWQRVMREICDQAYRYSASKAEERRLRGEAGE